MKHSKSFLLTSLLASTPSAQDEYSPGFLYVTAHQKESMSLSLSFPYFNQLYRPGSLVA